MYPHLIFYGLLSALLAALIEAVIWLLFPEAFLPLFSSVLAVLSASLLAVLLSLAAIEEGAKILFLSRYRINHPLQDTPSFPQALLWGSAFGFGFALVEIVPILILAPGTWLFLGNFVFHVATGMLYALLLFREQRLRAVYILAWLALTVFHTLYNLFILM